MYTSDCLFITIYGSMKNKHISSKTINNKNVVLKDLLCLILSNNK